MTPTIEQLVMDLQTKAYCAGVNSTQHDKVLDFTELNKAREALLAEIEILYQADAAKSCIKAGGSTIEHIRTLQPDKLDPGQTLQGIQ